MTRIKIGRYKHFKGKEYKVLGAAKHSETMGELVVYQAQYGKRELWARPVKMFLEKVKLNGKKIPRFNYIKK